MSGTLDVGHGISSLFLNLVSFVIGKKIPILFFTSVNRQGLVTSTFCCGNALLWLAVRNFMGLRLLFSLKPKEMAKMRLLVIWIDQR